MPYAFRVRFKQSPGSVLKIEAPSLALPTVNGTHLVTLKTLDKDTPIDKSTDLILIGEGFASVDEAAARGAEYRDVLRRAMARSRVGSDFGMREPKAVMTSAGLALLQHGSDRPVLHDEPGVAVFPAPPWPKFSKVTIKTVRGAFVPRFLGYFSKGLAADARMTNREDIAFQLFHGSYFQEEADVRLILLVSAMEALIERADRTGGIPKHVDVLEGVTRAAALSDDERAAVMRMLDEMRRESIIAAGKKLIRDRLPEKVYDGQTAVRVFVDCYDLRSAVVHAAQPFPSWSDVSAAVGKCELLVGDLLAGPLLAHE